MRLTQSCFPEASQIHLHGQVAPRCTAELVGHLVGFTVKNLAMFGLGLYVYAGEDLPEDAAPQPEAEPQKPPKPKSTSQKPEQPPVPCICARCNQPIKRVKLKDGSIMQAAEFAATHEGMCADCYKATRLNVA